MIIDTLANAHKYHSVHPLFPKAFGYIESIDLDTADIGTHSVEADLVRAIFSENPGLTREKSMDEFECHNRHIDIQVCIRGKEEFGWKPRENCTLAKGVYHSDKDYQLYADAPDMYFQLNEGQFVILFPEDVHAPMISEHTIRKLVMKIKI